jgi:hypothetical protein
MAPPAALPVAGMATSEVTHPAVVPQPVVVTSALPGVLVPVMVAVTAAVG